MKISYNWIKSYFSNGLIEKIFNPMPSPEKLAELINAHSFEVEGIESVDGDTVLDIDILPNRSSDCMCHYGIAKEVSALIRRPLNHSFFKEKIDVSEKKFDGAKVEVETKNCNRYALALFDDVDNEVETPVYIVKRLRALGQRSINPIVDITNYIMLELGSPVHAFDAKTMSGGARVRMANKGEMIKLLGGNEKVLSEDDMVICNYETNDAVGIAGVKGGENSGANKGTKSIYLEIASFDPNTVRHTSRRHDLHTDASSRFAQSPSELIIPHILERAIVMIKNITGAKFSGVTYHRNIMDPVCFLGVNEREVKRMLGVSLSLKECQAILNRLHFDTEIIQNPRGSVLEYAKTLYGIEYIEEASVLHDSPNAFDCSSFVVHILCRFGIPYPRISCNQFLYSKKIDKKDVRPGDLVFSCRTTERNIIHYVSAPEESVYVIEGDIPDGGISHVGIMDVDEYVIHCTGAEGKKCVVREKLSESVSFVNISGFGRVEDMDSPRLVCKKPIERTDFEIPADLIEEIGRIYGYENIPVKTLEQSRGSAVEKRYAYQMIFSNIFSSIGFIEVETRSFSGKGELEVLYPLAKDKKFLRTNLSDALRESMSKNIHYIDLFGKKDIRIVEFGSVFKTEGEFYHMAIAISNQKEVDKIELEIKNKFKSFGIEFEANFQNSTVEIDFDKCIQDLPTPKEYSWLDSYKNKKYKGFSQYPFVIRDISMFVKNDMDKEKVVLIIQKNAKYLERITFVDRFEKDSKISLTFRIIFQAKNKTLTDIEINSVMKDIEEHLQKEGCEIR